MSRRKLTAKTKPAALLEKLRPEEAASVLNQLLDKHPDLKSEAGELATQMMSAASIEDVAEEVYFEITSIDLEALTGRAGAHSWGYVEPSEAADELLTEAIEDRVEEMKRSLELGLLSSACALCAGIVQGLYRARDTKSDGALGWAVDFPIQEARLVVIEFLTGCHPSSRKAAHEDLTQVLAQRVPEWIEGLERAAERAVRQQGC